MSNDSGGIEGVVTWELRDENGEIKNTGVSWNIITDSGDLLYASNGAGGGTITPATKPTGMQLGTGSTAVAKNGAGSFITTYLPNSDHTFDAGFPTATVPSAGNGAVVTYKVTYAANEATSASTPITEAAIVNKTLVANGAAGGSAGTAGQTIARVLLSGIGSKAASDTLTITWTHNLRGQ